MNALSALTQKVLEFLQAQPVAAALLSSPNTLQILKILTVSFFYKYIPKLVSWKENLSQEKRALMTLKNSKFKICPRLETLLSNFPKKRSILWKPLTIL